MKKILLFLLLIPSLLTAQKVEYFPKRDANWNIIRDIGFAVLTPDNYDGSQKWKLEIAIHGVGERSAGTIENLKNLVLGFDYNNDGVREGAAFVTDDMKAAVNKYGIVLFVPTYEADQFFEPASINYLYDYAQSHYSLYPKMLLTGFSYGGGATIKYATSNTVNAGKLAYAVPCAATNSMVDATVPGKVNLPIHFFSNDNDPTVNFTTNTFAMFGKVNNTTITPKPLYTAFRKDGHGSNIEAWSLTPPKAPAGQGFTDAAENIYQVFGDIIATGKPRQMKSGSVIPSPEPAPVPVTQAIAKFTLIGANLKLDGSSSTGWTSGTDGVWEYVSGPVKYSWDVFTQGSSYIVANTTLKVPGKYVFAFKLKGDPNVQTITVDFGKTPVSFDSETDLITYSDGSTEKGIAIFSGGKLIIKNISGAIVIQL